MEKVLSAELSFILLEVFKESLDDQLLFTQQMFTKP